MGIYVKRVRRRTAECDEPELSEADREEAQEEAMARLRARLERMPIPGDKAETIERILKDARRHPEDFEDVLNEGHAEIFVQDVLVGEAPTGTVMVSPKLTEYAGLTREAEPHLEFEGRRVRLRLAFAENLPEHQIAISRHDSDELQYRPGKRVRLSFGREDFQDGLMQLTFTGDESYQETRDMITLGYSQSANQRRARTDLTPTRSGPVPHKVMSAKLQRGIQEPRNTTLTTKEHDRRLITWREILAVGLIAAGFVVLMVVFVL